jgi:hypothetical protein
MFEVARLAKLVWMSSVLQNGSLRSFLLFGSVGSVADEIGWSKWLAVATWWRFSLAYDRTAAASIV